MGFVFYCYVDCGICIMVVWNMRIMLTVFGIDYSMPRNPHVFLQTINNCYVELRAVIGTKFHFMVSDCDHPTIQKQFVCEWYQIAGEIETAVLLVVAQRNKELRKLND